MKVMRGSENFKWKENWKNIEKKKQNYTYYKWKEN